MAREEEVVTAGNSDCGPAMVERSPATLMVRRLPSTAASGQEPPWVEADPVGWDAPISLWWDYPPARDHGGYDGQGDGASALARTLHGPHLTARLRAS